jgi:hypothetical protein
MWNLGGGYNVIVKGQLGMWEGKGAHIEGLNGIKGPLWA